MCSTALVVLSWVFISVQMAQFKDIKEKSKATKGNFWWNCFCWCLYSSKVWSQLALEVFNFAITKPYWFIVIYLPFLECVLWVLKLIKFVSNVICQKINYYKLSFFSRWYMFKFNVACNMLLHTKYYCIQWNNYLSCYGHKISWHHAKK